MRMILAAAVSLAACTPQPPAVANGGGGASAPAVDPLAACDGAKADALLGRPVDAAMRAEALRLVGARTLRVIAPGTAVTMDYRSDRLNIDTDAAGKAARFYCG